MSAGDPVLHTTDRKKEKKQASSVVAEPHVKVLNEIITSSSLSCQKEEGAKGEIDEQTEIKFSKIVRVEDDKESGKIIVNGGYEVKRILQLQNEDKYCELQADDRMFFKHFGKDGKMRRRRKGRMASETVKKLDGNVVVVLRNGEQLLKRPRR